MCRVQYCAVCIIVNICVQCTLRNVQYCKYLCAVYICSTKNVCTLRSTVVQYIHEIKNHHYSVNQGPTLSQKNSLNLRFIITNPVKVGADASRHFWFTCAKKLTPKATVVSAPAVMQALLCVDLDYFFANVGWFEI